MPPPPAPLPAFVPALFARHYRRHDADTAVPAVVLRLLPLICVAARQMLITSCFRHRMRARVREFACAWRTLMMLDDDMPRDVVHAPPPTMFFRFAAIHSTRRRAKKRQRC